MIPLELRACFFHASQVFWILVLDEGDGYSVQKEHHICPVSFLSAVPIRPLVGNVELIVCEVLEVDHPDVAVSLLALVVDSFISTQPLEHLAIAVDGVGDALKAIDYGINVVGGNEPRIQGKQSCLKVVVEE